MKTVKKRIITKIEEKKSIFISVLDQVHSKEEFLQLLYEVKESYPGATHYCYAYILDQDQYFSDDKEPSKTAGFPILNVLEHHKFNHVACIVIRYYGGVKLGTGGLTRAYSKVTLEGVKKAEVKEFVKGIKVSLSFSYEEQKNIDYLLKNAIIEEKDYQETITYIAKLSLEDEILLQKNKISYQILESCFL